MLFASIRASLRNVREPIVFNRRLSVMDERKAMVLFFAAFLAIILGIFIIVLLEGQAVSHLESQGRLIAIRLEVVSALSTVGLSTGLTSELSTESRFLLIALMLIGRLGPLTIIAAWLGPRPHRPFTAPEESMPIG